MFRQLPMRSTYADPYVDSSCQHISRHMYVDHTVNHSMPTHMLRPLNAYTHVATTQCLHTCCDHSMPTHIPSPAIMSIYTHEVLEL